MYTVSKYRYIPVTDKKRQGHKHLTNIYTVRKNSPIHITELWSCSGSVSKQNAVQ